MTTHETPWGPTFGRGFRRPRFARPGPARPDFCGPEEAAMHDENDEEHGPHRGHRHHRGPRGRGRGPGGPFGPGFGPGGPFGPGGFGPGGFGPGGFGPGGFGPGGPGRGFGRRGRRTARGDVRTAVLAVLADGPRHGYEIIQEITARSGGQWKPSPGSVYPMLSQLEDERLVRSEQTDGRRVVHLTEEGTRHVEEHRAALDAVWAPFSEENATGDEPGDGLGEELSKLFAAAQQVAAAGSAEQITSATESLAEARKALYRLLAE
ncbi:PadR family transcriptional regulator [Pseudonocardia parietis]|uniref:DNA-binding PadR family transcriptional regulator n=1 Tax=Pseudonocardia parietis TaxID=570936 RepID=A0ABS4VT62_9PSEU|nr:PadR family transcriptional regulator [Pseudonocardia parietis]MBP2367110.1 DNA-binding PadR family transcriptional regulator [Pseudonocardia parietis]